MAGLPPAMAMASGCCPAVRSPMAPRRSPARRSWARRIWRQTGHPRRWQGRQLRHYRQYQHDHWHGRVRIWLRHGVERQRRRYGRLHLRLLLRRPHRRYRSVSRQFRQDHRNQHGGSGVYLRNGGTVTNGSATDTVASIAGGAFGIEITHARGTVSNFGTIAGTSTDAGRGIVLSEGGSVINGSNNDKSA